MTATAFNADAVIWNLDKLLNDKSPQFDPEADAQARGRIPTLIGYKKIDDYTIELETRIVNSLFPYDMSYIFYSSPTNWEKLGKDWVKVALNPAGTGPFKVDRMVPRERLDLSRFDGYWDKARVPKLDKVILYPMPEAATRTAALLSGQIDWIEVPAPDALPRLKQSNMVIVSNKYPHNWAYQPSMTEGSPFLDIRVRKAANLAIDRAGVKKLVGDMAVESKGQRLSRPPVVWHAELRHQVRSGGRQGVAEGSRLQRHQQAQDQDRDLDLGLGPDAVAADERVCAGEPQRRGLRLHLRGDGVERADLRLPAGDGRCVQEGGHKRINISRAFVDPYSAFMRLMHSEFIPPKGANWGLLKEPKLDALIDKRATASTRPNRPRRSPTRTPTPSTRRCGSGSCTTSTRGR